MDVEHLDPVADLSLESVEDVCELHVEAHSLTVRLGLGLTVRYSVVGVGVSTAPCLSISLSAPKSLTASTTSRIACWGWG